MHSFMTSREVMGSETRRLEPRQARPAAAAVPDSAPLQERASAAAGSGRRAFSRVAPPLTEMRGQLAVALPAASLELLLRNATKAAYEAFLARLASLEAEYVFMYPNQHSRGHVFSCIRPYSAVFTVFFSVVFTR